MSTPRVAVVADDLIWSTRLEDAVRSAGGDPAPVRSQAAVTVALETVGHVIVDLTARAYDPIAVIAAAVAAGLHVLAVGQHTDLDARRRALEAGADRVIPYRKLHDDGPGTISAWLGDPVAPLPR